MPTPRLPLPAVVLLTVLAACTEPATAPPPVGLANPASVYCEDSGGRSEIRQDATGAYGVCVLADGTEVDEWAYYRANAEG